MSRLINVVYDHQVFSWQEYGGISRYFYELATRVDRARDFSASVIAPLHVNRYLEAGGIAARGFKIPVLPKTLRLRVIANRYLSAALVRAAAPDLLHETFYERTPLPRVKCPIVITVHDMIHEKFRAKFEAHNRTSEAKRAAVRRADRIICVSECTRRDLLELFDVDPEKVETIHLGFSLQTNAAVPGDGAAGVAVPSVAARGIAASGVAGAGVAPPGVGVPSVATSLVLPPHRPYLLFVGRRGGHKNFSAVLDAYLGSARLRTEIDLVAFGGDRFSAEERAEIHAKAGADEVRIHHWSGNDALLSSAYRRAVALIYPSLYEGFGIPPLEAMSLGCPVLCSDASSIPEIVGDAGLYFDPCSADSIRHGIETAVDSPALRADLAARGRVRATAFSYDRCAERTMAVYRDLVPAGVGAV